jgi:hypothetical protein
MKTQIKWTKHAWIRLKERSRLETCEVNEILEKEFYVVIGMEKDKSHILFYSLMDGCHYVLVIDNIMNEVVTFLHPDYNRWAISMEALNDSRKAIEDQIKKEEALKKSSKAAALKKARKRARKAEKNKDKYIVRFDYWQNVENGKCIKTICLGEFSKDECYLEDEKINPYIYDKIKDWLKVNNLNYQMLNLINVQHGATRKNYNIERCRVRAIYWELPKKTKEVKIGVFEKEQCYIDDSTINPSLYNDIKTWFESNNLNYEMLHCVMIVNSITNALTLHKQPKKEWD